MGIMTIPCLIVLAAFSLALLQPNIRPILAHAVDQNATPAPAPEVQQVQQPEVRERASDVAVHPVQLQPQLEPTDVLNNKQPCAIDSGRQMQYWPLGPPGSVGAPGRLGLV